jgi:hypothetical protein
VIKSIARDVATGDQQLLLVLSAVNLYRLAQGRAIQFKLSELSGEKGAAFLTFQGTAVQSITIAACETESEFVALAKAHASLQGDPPIHMRAVEENQ